MTATGASTMLTSGQTFLTFGGSETQLIFNQGFEMREFCAFEVFDHEPVWQQFEEVFLRPIADAAAAHGHGFVTDCMVWRASPDYLAKLGYAANDLGRLNRIAVQRVRKFVSDWRTASNVTPEACPVALAADIGPRGDGYAVEGEVSVDAARSYHAAQIGALVDEGVELLIALTITSPNEAVGLVHAARDAGVAIVVSPTVETDGRLPDGSLLSDFVRQVDDQTDRYPQLFMVNCAHPLHIEPTLRAAADEGAAWLERFGGFRSNASTKSHEELDNSTELDRGAPTDLAERVAAMKKSYGLSIVGGCCGTDAEHIAAIAASCA